MSLSSASPALAMPLAAGRSSVAAEPKVAAALGRCGPLFRRSVLVAFPAESDGWEAIRVASEGGARVTAFCPADQATRAMAAGAEVILDPARTDPTWYRGAWSVIVDTTGGIGFLRARASLAPDGVYLTSSATPSDRARAWLGRMGGGPRLLRSRG